ncbi:MAG TPA: enoyl-CoA hydratase/isomerase family protein, partial [Dehalococcoidia bacterium]|nr:enoyl-CoA hydratase/isomerase family protein [Dehalococcoidia bacterium]
MAYQYIRYEREDSLAVLTFNRPEVRNALSYASIDEALDAVAQFEADDAARVLILTGAGEQAFIAGADIKELQARDILTEMGERSGRRRVLTGKLESMPKPSIAAINGFATGGGLEMALACTLRIAA